MTTDGSPARPGRLLIFLLPAFAGSGFATMIYETAWAQWAPLVIGSLAVSRAVYLGVWFIGMALGAMLLPRLAKVRWNAFRVYGLIELGGAAAGLVTVFLLPRLGKLYLAHSGVGWGDLGLRAGFCAVAFAPSAVLAGGALAAMARLVSFVAEDKVWLGFTYAANAAGAVLGCLWSVFHLLRLNDNDAAAAVYTGAAIHGVMALTLFGLSMTGRREFVGQPAPPAFAGPSSSGGALVCLAVAFSGASAMGAGVVWARLLSLALGGTVFTQAVLVAGFLAGLGAGAGAGAIWARKIARLRLALGWCQLLVAAAISWAAWMLCQSLPYWPVDAAIAGRPVFKFELDLVRCLWAVLPATFLWGAGFSLALAATAAPGREPGRAAGGILGAALLGAGSGGVVCGWFLLGRVGTRQSQQILMGASCCAAILLFIPERRPAAGRRPTANKPGTAARWGRALAASLAGAGLVFALAWSIPFVPWGLVAYGRHAGSNREAGTPLYAGEGREESVAVTELGQFRVLHANGRAEASTALRDLRVQKMLGQIPALLHPYPRSVLVAGCGLGITAGCFMSHSSVGRIVVCEPEALVPRIAGRYFSRENNGVLEDPRTILVLDDPRHYLLASPEKFDVITMNPGHPWLKGAAASYTKECVEAAKARLQPGGFLALWAPLSETSLDSVKSEVVTFLEVFPNATLWGTDLPGDDSDLVLVGALDPLRINLDEVQQRWDRNGGLAQSLREAGFLSPAALFGSYAGQGADLGLWLLDAEMNRDENLRLQFEAGLSLDRKQARAIRDELRGYLRFPEEIFTGSPQRRQAVKFLVKKPVAARQAEKNGTR